MGLFAVIGPSMNDQCFLPRFFSCSLRNASVSSHHSRIRCSILGKSSLLSTPLNILFSVTYNFPLTNFSTPKRQERQGPYGIRVSRFLSMSQQPHTFLPWVPGDQPC